MATPSTTTREQTARLVGLLAGGPAIGADETVQLLEVLRDAGALGDAVAKHLADDSLPLASQLATSISRLCQAAVAGDVVPEIAAAYLASASFALAQFVDRASDSDPAFASGDQASAQSTALVAASYEIDTLLPVPLRPGGGAAPPAVADVPLSSLRRPPGSKKPDTH